MGFIKDFFDFIINSVTQLWGFFTGFIEDLILLVKYVGVAFDIATSSLMYMPSWLRVFGTITIGVCVVYLLIGRDTGKGQ